MTETIVGFSLSMAVNVGLVALAAYLAYVKFKHVPVLKKYQPGTPVYEGYSKLYNQDFLIIAGINAILSIIRASLDIAVFVHGSVSSQLAMTAFAAHLVAFVAVVYFAYDLFVKKHQTMSKDRVK